MEYCLEFIEHLDSDIHMFKHNLVFLVPSAVSNVTVSVMADGLLVTWSEPENPNGELLFNITLAQDDLASMDTILPELSTTTALTESFFSLSLLPYHLYTATVTPFTGAGGGEEDMGSLQTEEDSKIMCLGGVRRYLLQQFCSGASE